MPVKKTVCLYNRSITRLIVADAEVSREGQTAKPSFLVAAIDFHMLSAFILAVDELPKDQAGCRSMFLLGCWGRTDRLRALDIDVHISHGAEIRFVSVNTTHATPWFDLLRMATVFERRSPHVLLGGDDFRRRKGRQIVERLKLRLPEYSTLKSRLQEKISDVDDTPPPKVIVAGVESFPLIR